MTDGDEDDRTQRLVAELAEVRRRMSRRAIPAAPKSRADASEENPRATSSHPPENGAATTSGPRPALGSKIPTQRIVLEPPDPDLIPTSRRPTKP